ncbi:MAG: nitroreductase [Chitinophagales bacterium]
MEEQVISRKEIRPLTETMEVINARRSVRKYKNRPVNRATIEQVINAGMMAPSAINKQPWKFYILTDKEMIRSFDKAIAKVALKDFSKSGVKGIVQTAGHLLHAMQNFNLQAITDPIFHGAPVVIFITAPAKNEWAPLDIGMCAQNIMLAAKSMGLDTCPVGLAKFVMEVGLYSKLNIPASEKVLLAIILGYGNEEPVMHERIKDRVVFINLKES